MNLASWIVTAGLALMVSGCAVGSSGANDWQTAVSNNVNRLGYRNWIVICEASFPAHSRAGVHQVNAPVEVPEALDYVLRAIEQTEHVKPRIYLPREMRSVENDYAPGIDEFRKRMKGALHGHETTELDQDALVTLIKDANRDFSVLVVRTTTALPYSSVFMELQPGYWDGDSESHLRRRIELERERMNRLARPIP